MARAIITAFALAVGLAFMFTSLYTIKIANEAKKAYEDRCKQLKDAREIKAIYKKQHYEKELQNRAN